MSASDVKICWVCHSSENGDNSNAWINPCKCKGSVKWCHQACLRPWIQYKIDNRRAVQCDICNYRYKIRFPPTPAKCPEFRFDGSTRSGILRVSHRRSSQPEPSEEAGGHTRILRRVVHCFFSSSIRIPMFEGLAIVFFPG